MRTITKWAVAALLVGASAGAANADIYIRKGDQPIEVQIKDGKLYCWRIKDNFHMCNGMTKQPDGSWKGGHMKHPDMPGFMTFNGTVTFLKDSLKIRGCAIGICASEVWQKQKK